MLSASKCLAPTTCVAYESPSESGAKHAKSFLAIVAPVWDPFVKSGMARHMPDLQRRECATICFESQGLRAKCLPTNAHHA